MSAAPPADAIKTASGLASKVLQIGFSNVRPSARSTVRVHYTGWTTDGKMFDSSVVRGEPTEFPLEPGDPRLDGRRAADGGRREAPLLDPWRPRLRQHPQSGCAQGYARLRYRTARGQIDTDSFECSSAQRARVLRVLRVLKVLEVRQERTDACQAFFSNDGRRQAPLA